MVDLFEIGYSLDVRKVHLQEGNMDVPRTAEKVQLGSLQSYCR